MLVYSYKPGDAEEARRKEIVAYLIGRYEKSKCLLCGKDWKDGGTPGTVHMIQPAAEFRQPTVAMPFASLPVVCICGSVQLFAADALPEQLRANP